MAENLTNKTLSVGTTQVQVSPELLPGQRRFISIINTSTGTQKITIAFNQDAIAGSGIVLSVGGSYSALYPVNYGINAISDQAGGTLAVTERIGAELDPYSIPAGSVTVNSGLVTATISGNVTSVPAFPSASASQTIVAKSANTKAGVAIVAGTGLLLHTTTGGKTFYMTSCDFGSTVSCGVVLYDNTTASGTIKLCEFNNVTYPKVHVFPTPIPFSTGVFVDVGTGTSDFRWSIQGFEQ